MARHHKADDAAADDKRRDARLDVRPKINKLFIGFDAVLYVCAFADRC